MTLARPSTRAKTDRPRVPSSWSIALRLTTPTTSRVTRSSTGPPESPGHTLAWTSKVDRATARDGAALALPPAYPLGGERAAAEADGLDDLAAPRRVVAERRSSPRRRAFARGPGRRGPPGRPLRRTAARRSPGRPRCPTAGSRRRAPPGRPSRRRSVRVNCRSSRRSTTQWCAVSTVVRDERAGARHLRPDHAHDGIARGREAEGRRERRSASACRGRLAAGWTGNGGRRAAERRERSAAGCRPRGERPRDRRVPAQRGITAP